MAVHADDRGPSDLGLAILVLMAVDDQLRLSPVNAVSQRIEALTYAILAVEVRNYDTDGADWNRHMKFDMDGDAYQSLVFGGPRKRARDQKNVRQAR